MNEKEASDLVKFFFEVGQAKYVKRTGWWVAKVRDPENIAQHSFRTAVIALVLAALEGRCDAEKTAAKALVHDLPEARVLDLHKISTRYVKNKKALEKAWADQCSRLPQEIRRQFTALGEEDYLVRDADYLEVALQAREYFDLGYKDAWDWIERVDRVLKTRAAKQLLARIKKMDSGSWWRGLKQSVEELKY